MLTPQDQMEMENKILKKLLAEVMSGKAQRITLREATERAQQKAPVDWTKVEHTCPSCQKKGFINPDFGVRILRGKELKQSYCKECRGKLNYHNRPRKYKTRNS